MSVGVLVGLLLACRRDAAPVSEFDVCVAASRDFAVEEGDPNDGDIDAWMRACGWIYAPCDRGYLVLPEDGHETPTSDPILLVLACVDPICRDQARGTASLCTINWREQLAPRGFEYRIDIARRLHVALLEFHAERSTVTIETEKLELIADAATRMWAVYLRRLMSIRASPPVYPQPAEPPN